MSQHQGYQSGYPPVPQAFSPPPPGYDLPPAYASQPPAPVHPVPPYVNGYYSAIPMGYHQGFHSNNSSPPYTPLTNPQTTLYVYEEESKDKEPDPYACCLLGLCSALCCFCLLDN